VMKQICSSNTRICLISPTISERPVYTFAVISSTAIYSNSKRQAVAAAKKKKKRFALSEPLPVFATVWGPVQPHEETAEKTGLDRTTIFTLSRPGTY